jgi:ATP-dependent RNA helicase DeaD
MDTFENQQAAAPDAGLPEAPPASRGFEAMNLDPSVKQALDDMGYAQPMPVQTAVYDLVVGGTDVMVQSRTGSGKTAAFGIPIAQKLPAGAKGVQALVLAPTRELALQVAQEVGRICAYKNLAVVPIYGGAPMGRQVDALKAGAQIIAGTPGRVLDHIRRGTLDLSGVKMFVLDECDEMLSMGFLEDIEKIIAELPSKENRQTLLFSATMPEDIERIAKRHMRPYEKIALSEGNVSVSDISHHYYLVSGLGRTRDLLRVIEFEQPESAIIFCNTRDDTSMVAGFLQRSGYDAEAISSDLGQSDRERVMGRMRDKNLRFLVATDIAARGIDISDLSHVINYTFPESPEVYVHRTGRTGRAGKSGTAISLIGPREIGAFYYLKLIYKIRPEEREFPSEREIRTRREAERFAKINE